MNTSFTTKGAGKVKRTLYVVLVSLSLSSCAVLPALSIASSIVEATAPTIHKVEVPATQALIIAHNAYQGAAAAATAAVRSGVVKGDKLELLAQYDNTIKGLLDKADAGQNVAMNAASAMNFITKIHNLIGG